MTVLRVCRFFMLMCLALLAGCSNGRGSVEEAQAQTAPTAFTVSATVSGLAGSGLVLQINGADNLTVTADGAVAFSTPLADGAAYSVTVLSQPASQTCTVTNAAGTMAGGDVENVAVTCATGAFTVGGTLLGLVGRGLTLQNNGADDLALATDGSFVFKEPIANGAAYNVTVGVQPTTPLQTCTVGNPAGTIDGVNVTKVIVSCAAHVFAIGGTVHGLSGSGLVLQLNKGNDRTITSDSPFQFEIGLASGAPYLVEVKTQPGNPTQTCAVANASGIVAGSEVKNVVVTCTTPSFAIGGTVAGLVGSGLVLQKNGGDDLAIASNGSFTFATEQASGTAYAVTVATQPLAPAQTCTAENGGGTVGGGNIRNVRVTCAINSYSIGGAVSGLLGGGLVLQNSGGDDLGVDADGAFVFPAAVASGGAYNVSVRTQPVNPTQACSVTNGTGTIGATLVTNVAVACTTSSFMIGGAVSGLAGSGLRLRNNGADELAIEADGAFTFATALVSGGTYNITLAAQPTGPAQNCTIAHASGVVGGGHITNVQVSCITIEFTVGLSVSGLAGSGLTLQNNGGDNFAIAADGAFTFPASLATGAPYNVSVLTQPANPTQTCVVANGAGAIAGADVTNVTVACTTNSYTIGGVVMRLLGFGLTLQNNGGDTLPVTDSGFTFATALPSGGTYNVTIASQPFLPPQSCTVANETGTVGGANVTDLVVTCL